MATSQQRYYCGMTITQVYPLLKIVAIQNGLDLSRMRQFRIARNILAKSIVKN